MIELRTLLHYDIESLYELLSFDSVGLLMRYHVYSPTELWRFSTNSHPDILMVNNV